MSARDKHELCEILDRKLSEGFAHWAQSRAKILTCGEAVPHEVALALCPPENSFAAGVAWALVFLRDAIGHEATDEKAGTIAMETLLAVARTRSAP